MSDMMFSFMFAEGPFPRFMGRARSGRISRGSKAQAEPDNWRGPARRKGAALNPGASGPKPMKKTDGMILRPCMENAATFQERFWLQNGFWLMMTRLLDHYSVLARPSRSFPSDISRFSGFRLRLPDQILCLSDVNYRS